MTANGSTTNQRIPRHIAMIMDGNGRWAQQRGLPRLAGHRAGTENIRAIVRACGELGVQYLTLYAFSTENWSRPPSEVDGLMVILGEFIDRETQEFHRNGVQLRHLGQLEGVKDWLIRKIHYAIELTRGNSALTLSIAFNYGGRHDIVQAVRALVAQGVPAEAIDDKMIAGQLSTAGLPDPDLIIRTSGEWRLSNFLIWEAAYSEYWTTPVFWPDFGSDQLYQAVQAYGQRERRFGGITKKS